MTEIESTGKLLNFSSFRPHSHIFIETGSARGDGIQAALDAGFKVIKSVEAKDTYFVHCQDKFSGNPNIELFFGLSKDLLPLMLASVKESAVFWLDAHASGESSAGHFDLMEKGDKSDYHQHNALVAELKIALAHRNDHVFLIDDQNGRHSQTQDYLDMMLAVNPNYKFYFYDERRGNDYYKDKILVAIP